MSISDLSKAGGNGVNAWPSWMRIALLGLLALLLLGIFFPGIDDDLRAEVVMFAALAGAALLTLRSFLNGAQVRRERRQEIATAGSYGFTPSKSWEAHQIPVLDQMSLTSPLRNAPHTERGMLVGNVVAGRKTILFSKAYLPKRDDLFLKFTGVFGFFLRPPIHFDFTYCMVDLTPEEQALIPYLVMQSRDVYDRLGVDAPRAMVMGKEALELESSELLEKYTIQVDRQGDLLAVRLFFQPDFITWVLGQADRGLQVGIADGKLIVVLLGKPTESSFVELMLDTTQKAFDQLRSVKQTVGSG